MTKDKDLVTKVENLSKAENWLIRLIRNYDQIFIKLAVVAGVPNNVRIFFSSMEKHYQGAHPETLTDLEIQLLTAMNRYPHSSMDVYVFEGQPRFILESSYQVLRPGDEFI